MLCPFLHGRSQIYAQRILGLVRKAAQVTFFGNVCLDSGLGMQGEICHLHWAMNFLTIKHHQPPSRNRARQCCLRLQFTQSAPCCAIRRGGHVSLHRRLWCPTSSYCMKCEAWAYHGGVRAPQVNIPAELGHVLDNRVPLPSQIRQQTFGEIPRHKRPFITYRVAAAHSASSCQMLCSKRWRKKLCVRWTLTTSAADSCYPTSVREQTRTARNLSCQQKNMRRNAHA